MIIIIMFNSVNEEILHSNQPQLQQQKLQLPSLVKPQIVKMPVNYIKQYFQSRSLISIPHIPIATFYQKIHKIRTIFINQLPNPKQFLVKQYRINLPVALNDNLINSSHSIIEKIQSLQKQKFIYQEDLDYKKTKRVYFGEMALGKKQGYGIYAEYQSKDSHQNGSHFYFYQGFFSQNQKNGLGIQWSNNRIFIGQFINNTHFSHSEAIFLYSNGDLFIGSIFNYKRNGRGVLFQSKIKESQHYKYQASQKYSNYQCLIVGCWQNDEISRKNKFSLNKNVQQIFSINLYDYSYNLIIKATSIYVGDVKRIGVDSQQQQTLPKEVYIKEGKGFEYFCNGDVYKGQYLNDKPQGFGHYIWENKDEYQGQFMRGWREGTGKWNGSNGEQFEGEYQKDKRNGYGVYNWPNGNIYQGQFKNDNRHGLGKMSWSNGETYMGRWKQGLQHGKGEVRANLNSFNIKKKLIFENGRPITRSLNKPKVEQQKASIIDNKKMKKRMSLVEIKDKKFNRSKVLVKGNTKTEACEMIKENTIQDSEQIIILLDDDIPKIQPNTDFKQDQTKISLPIKSVIKSVKKDKFKISSMNKKDQISHLGETLLRPIKWTNFKQAYLK